MSGSLTRYLIVIFLVFPTLAFSQNDENEQEDDPAQTAADPERIAVPKKSGSSPKSKREQKKKTAVKGARGTAGKAAPLDGEALEAAPLDGEALENDEAAQRSTDRPPISSPPLISSEAKQLPDLSRDANTLDTINITGDAESIDRVSGSAHLVDKETLEAQEYDDVHRVLKQVPGVYVRDEDGYGLRPNIGLRGANSDRSAKITLMEDGVLMAPAPYSAPAAYYFPLTTRLTGVEVFKGPASIKYGPNTIGGAVNLITRSTPARGQVGGIDLSTGMRQSRKVHGYYGMGTEHYGLLLEGATLASDGFKELDGGGDTGFDKAELMLKLRANNGLLAKNHQRIELKLGYASERSNETYLGLTDADFEETPYRRYAGSQLGEMDWMRLQGKLTYTAFLGEDIEIRVTGYRHVFQRKWQKLNGFSDLSGVSVLEVLADPKNPRHSLYYDLLRGANEWTGAENERLAIGTNARSFVSQGVQTVAQWRWESDALGNTLELGLRYHHDDIDRDHTEAEYDVINGTNVRATKEAYSKRNTGTADAISAHLFDEIRVGKTIRITPGLRLESIHTELQDRYVGGPSTTNDSLVILPGVGAWIGLNDHWGLLAGVHQGFSPLSPGQSDDAEPEKSTNYEFGTRWAYRRLRGELIGFFNDYDNLVGTCTQSAGCADGDLDRQFNAGEAHITGLEAVAGTKIPFDGRLVVNMDVTYTWTHARFASSFASGFAQWGQVETDDALPYVPEHQVNLKLGAETNTMGISMAASFVDEMRDVAGQDTPADSELVAAHTVIDIAAFYRPSAQGRIYLTIDNVLGTEYMVSRRPYGARPGKPFHMNLGYSHTF